MLTLIYWIEKFYKLNCLKLNNIFGPTFKIFNYTTLKGVLTFKIFTKTIYVICLFLHLGFKVLIKIFNCKPFTSWSLSLELNTTLNILLKTVL